MKKVDNRGAVNGFLIAFIVMTMLFLAAASFGVWAFMSRQDYKDNTDKKIADAVVIAKQEESTIKDNEFVQKEKEPTKEYKGPEAYGSVSIKYPKTWSAYVIENSTAVTPVDGYFYPNFVPGVLNNSSYALRVEVVSKTYDTVLRSFDITVKSGKLKAAPFKAPKVPDIVGTRLDGELGTGKHGSMIVIPLRDKALKISTEIDQFAADFNNIILPNLTFSP